MILLSKIWSVITSLCKSLWTALNEEPANNVLGQDLPPDDPTDNDQQN